MNWIVWLALLVVLISLIPRAFREYFRLKIEKKKMEKEIEDGNN